MGRCHVWSVQSVHTNESFFRRTADVMCERETFWHQTACPTQRRRTSSGKLGKGRARRQSHRPSKPPQCKQCMKKAPIPPDPPTSSPSKADMPTTTITHKVRAKRKEE